jgi:hypothetical protein
MELFLMQKIETLRNQMVQEALDEGQLTNEKVIALSQKLDRYIVFYQRFKKQASNVIVKHGHSKIISSQIMALPCR